jgi:hypothetical protein
MPTPFESAQLNLQLFDLRRDPVLREARAWFLADFNPETMAELVAIVSGERNPSFRMVLGYWDMAASLVTTDAIDADAFRWAHNEIFGTFSKIEPFLQELRSATGETEFCKHIEAVVMSAPDAAAILARRPRRYSCRSCHAAFSNGNRIRLIMWVIRRSREDQALSSGASGHGRVCDSFRLRAISRARRSRVGRHGRSVLRHRLCHDRAAPHVEPGACGVLVESIHGDWCLKRRPAESSSTCA